MPTANDNLTRARRAFEVWRANRQRRTRIPPDLWEKAVSLLDHHPITRVARELRLDPAELRKRRLASAQSLAPSTSPAPQFVEVRSSDLNCGTGSALKSGAAPHLFTEAPLRLQIERADGHRLTLSLPSSEWSRVEALYSAFIRP